MRKILFFVNAVTVLLSVVSCSENMLNEELLTANETTTESEEVILSDYAYETEDFGGYTFRIYTFDDVYGSFSRVNVDEQTGDALEDAIWKRNRRVEEKLNIEIIEINEPCTTWGTSQNAMLNNVMQNVMAGDDAYDIAYLPLSFNPGIITDHYLLDMNEISTIHFEESYWDAALNDSFEIRNRLYAASSMIHLSTMEFCNVLLFNEKLFTSLDLEFPYQSVRDGTWTLDAWETLVKATANLNGDSSFSFSENGNAVYGIAGHNDFPMMFCNGAGNRLFTRNGDTYTLGIATERMYSTVEKLVEIFDSKSGHALVNSNTIQPSGYMNLFRSDRAAFITCEMKSANQLRDMDSTFGLLPCPKYDETQEEYYTPVNTSTVFLTIPTVGGEPERTGMILDVLSYASEDEVRSAYFDVTLSQKGLRNEDSIEMLEIIRKSRIVEFTQLFGITSNYVSNLNSSIVRGNANPASLAEKNETKIMSALEEVFAAVQ